MQFNGYILLNFSICNQFLFIHDCVGFIGYYWSTSKKNPNWLMIDRLLVIDWFNKYKSLYFTVYLIRFSNWRLFRVSKSKVPYVFDTLKTIHFVRTYLLKNGGIKRKATPTKLYRLTYRTNKTSHYLAHDLVSHTTFLYNNDYCKIHYLLAKGKG